MSTIVIGGAFSDRIDSDGSNIIAIGDSGSVTYQSIDGVCWSHASSIVSTLANLNDKDDIISLSMPLSTPVGRGVHIAIGGGNNDVITSTGAALSTVVGDYGEVIMISDVSLDDSNKLQRVAYYSNPTLGGTDVITTKCTGTSVIIGGELADSIIATGLHGILCGDDCSYDKQTMVTSWVDTMPMGGNDRLTFMGLNPTLVHLRNTNPTLPDSALILLG
jgi:hypothetical protein